MKRWNPILALAAILIAIPSFGTHMRGGQISIRMIEPLKGIIKLTAYLDTNSPVPFGGSATDILRIWHDGQVKQIQVPEINKNFLPIGAVYTVLDESKHLAMVEYSIPYVFQSFGNYVIGYAEVNRNVDILNMHHSVDTPLYFETAFTLKADAPLYHSPEIIPPLNFFFLANQPVALSLASSDTSDYSLYYKLRTPRASRDEQVLQYVFPGDIQINQYNGLLTWNGLMNDQPLYGEIAIAAYTYQYDGDELIGYSMIDFEIYMIEDNEIECTVQAKVPLNENNSFHVNAGEERSIKVVAEVSETEGDFSLTAYSELDSIAEADFSFQTYDSTANIKVGVITIKNTGPIERANPYSITVRATYDSYFPIQSDVVFLLYTTDDELPLPIISGVDGNEFAAELYPNPVQDYLTIKGVPHPLTSARLLNSAGIPSGELPFSNNTVDFRSVDSGFYLLQLTFGNHLIKTVKMVKTKQ